MKLFKSIFVLCFLISTFCPLPLFAHYGNNYFIVTAYYSPLPNQKSYLKWTYEKEIKLNGRGIKWASGRRVFPGMLAAPKNYKFWTKIYIEWLWIWTVEDRGAAIVNAWNRGYKNDRIDVWVWYWDEGLKRALYWGKRRVRWHIMSRNSKNSININKIPSPSWVTKNLNSLPNIFDIGIWIKSTKKIILQLQKFFNHIWLYNWGFDWIYNDRIISIVYDFQSNNNLIKSPYDYWAWYWGIRTRELFFKKYKNWEFEKENKKIIKTLDLNKKEDKYIKIFNNPLNWENSIKYLKEVFNKLFSYSGEINNFYDDKLKSVIFDYQLKKWLLDSESSLWAGYFWPKTRGFLKKEYLQFLKNEKLKKDIKNKFIIIQNNSLTKASNKVSSIWWNPKYWDISSGTRELQILLSDLWYFEHKDTAFFWKKTLDSIIDYQIEKRIIFNKSSPWAWIYWPKTRKSLISDLKASFVEKSLKEEKIDKSLLIKVWILDG